MKPFFTKSKTIFEAIPDSKIESRYPLSFLLILFNYPTLIEIGTGMRNPRVSARGFLGLGYGFDI